MKSDIDKVLRHWGPIRAREIAKNLGVDKSVVNRLLHGNREHYEQLADYTWVVKRSRTEIVLPSSWVTAVQFENALVPYRGLLRPDAGPLTFVFPKGCKPMVDCSARLLSLANQLVDQGQELLLDFSKENDTWSYLDRAGFFDILDDGVVVKPRKSYASRAKQRKGQSARLCEFGKIGIGSELKVAQENNRLAWDLTEHFVLQSGEEYRTAVSTVIAELVGNVSEHSETVRPAFAALQCYMKNAKTPHIQTIVSDSGLGIAKTLRPGLQREYPGLYGKFGNTKWSTDIGLVAYALKHGGISRRGNGNGGAGFATSSSNARKFRALYAVRQEDYCVEFYFEGTPPVVRVREHPNLVPLEGTHICFDFFL